MSSDSRVTVPLLPQTTRAPLPPKQRGSVGGVEKKKEECSPSVLGRLKLELVREAVPEGRVEDFLCEMTEGGAGEMDVCERWC